MNTFQDMILRNVGIQPHHYAAKQPRKPWILYLPPWKPQISQNKIYFF